MPRAITAVILLGLLCSLSVERTHAAGKPVSNAIDLPYNAEIAGIRVGYNTVGQLEHRLWPGATFERNRPDRAAVWKVKSTGWIVEANDGDYGHQEHTLYGYWIEMPDYKYTASAKGKICYVALSPRFLRFNRRIRLGMLKSKVMSTLRAMHIPTRGVNEVSWSKNGSWEASFQFQKGTLVAMGLDYS